MKLVEGSGEDPILHCIWAGPDSPEWGLIYKFESGLQQTTIQRMHLTRICMTKEICVTKETMIDYYKGKRSEQISIGDQVENFIASFRSSNFFLNIAYQRPNNYQ